MYSEENIVDTFAPGAFALCNDHQGLHNMINTMDIDSDNIGMHRYNNPGSGTFTPYYNLQTLATSDMKQGMELFASYGDHWYAFESRADKFSQ